MEKEVVKEKNEELSTTQNDLADKTDDVIEQIRDLPDGEDSADTGPNAIAAETEAIEWLLLAKRAGSGGGGGGGNSAGAGTRSGAAWRGSSLARLGGAKEKLSKVIKRNTNQATGKAGRDLPEEYRSGLDAYFEKLESQEASQ